MVVRDVKLYNVIVHSVAFMAMFTAFQTSSSYQATMLKDILGDKNIGFNSLAIIYVVFALANFVATPIVDKFGSKWCMVASGLIYALFISAFLDPMSWAIYVVSALLGFAAAVLWTAQGHLLTQCSDDTNRGRNSGIFWCVPVHSDHC